MSLRVLFFGLGSIGSRHLRILKNNYDIKFGAFRTFQGQVDLKDKITMFNCEEEAFDWNPDFVIIANPTYLHIEYARKCALRGIPFFLEKPLSNSAEGLNELVEIVQNKQLITYVAYVLRFHPVIKMLKKILDTSKEKFFYSRSVSTSYLPKWRIGQDYKKVFSSNSEMGGGVVLEMMHEYDYNCYLFGEPNDVNLEYAKISNLKIEVEDYAEISCTFDSIKTHISLNFFSPLVERYIILYGEDKTIKADLLNGSISSIDINGNRESLLNIEVNIDDIYLEQLDYYINNLKNNNFEMMNNIVEAVKIHQPIIKRKLNVQ